jgi:hypothetical protein
VAVEQAMPYSPYQAGSAVTVVGCPLVAVALYRDRCR